MRARVLGSAAGGGFPQWNCGCANCREARSTGDPSGSPRARARTQESVALSADGDSWFLLNASPEVRAQIEAFAPLHPRGPRHSPIAGLVLTNGDLDHCLGLLSLRESQPLCVYTTAAVRDGFVQGNSLARTLQRFDGQLRWVELELGRPTALLRADGAPSGLSIEAVPVPGKLPIHLEGRREPSPGDNIGLILRESNGRQLAYLPAVGSQVPVLERVLAEVDCCFFDGTFWSSDELIRLGLGDKRAEQMAHWPLGGPQGSLAFLEACSRPRRILIHINNTNPLLLEDSAERKQLQGAGVELAYDGMEVQL